MIRRRWIDFLGWIADRPVASAAVATLLLGILAASIRAPVVEGSMVDQLSGTNERFEVARRIQAAAGNVAVSAVILSPAAVSIEDAFADLEILRQRLAVIDDRIQLRSVDAAEEQLFAYGLSPDDAIAELLEALRDTPLSAPMIGADATEFLAVISSPEAIEADVLVALAAHDWGAVYERHRVLAAAQLENDIAQGLQKDLRLLLPAIVAATLVAIFLAFGDWRALFLPLFASVASTVVTFALFSTLVITINLVTLLALPVVLIVGLANSCHFLAKSDSVRRGDVEDDAAVRLTVRRVGPPFFFSTLTTAIALASLGFNDLPPIANLGLLSAAALLIVFLLVLLAAPLSLRWYLRGSTRSWRASRAFAAASRMLAAKRVPVSIVLLGVLAAGAAAIPFLSVKSEPRAFFPDEAPFASALRHFEQSFYFFSPLHLLVTPTSDDPVTALRSAGTLRDTLGDDSRVRRVAMDPAAGEPGAFVLNALLATESDLRGVLRLVDDHRAVVSGAVDVVYSNASLVYGDIDRQATESLLRSLGWSVALIFGAILLVFRSLRAVSSAMVANAAPLMLVCSVVWLIGNPLNLVTVSVFLVALGVVVDDSIHLLFWRASGDTIAGSSIEFSVVLSTVILCIGLVLCQLSDFPTTRLFAAYCALALTGAVVSNLTLLPLLLRRRTAD